MAISAIIFTAEDSELIRSATATSLSWGCDELAPLRHRIKQFYLAAQGLRCCYCRHMIPSTHGRVWDIEHVIAQALKPEFAFEPENLAIACTDCNSAKRDQDVLARPRKTFPRNSDAYTIVHPHYDEWDDHFLFGNIVYAPKTAKAAKTIELCKLYRFYDLQGRDTLIARDRRYADLAEGALFAKTAHEAEPSTTAIHVMVQEAVKAEINAKGTNTALYIAETYPPQEPPPKEDIRAFFDHYGSYPHETK